MTPLAYVAAIGYCAQRGVLVRGPWGLPLALSLSLSLSLLMTPLAYVAAIGYCAQRGVLVRGPWGLRARGVQRELKKHVFQGFHIGTHMKRKLKSKT
jgi:cation transport ATPase